MDNGRKMTHESAAQKGSTALLSVQQIVTTRGFDGYRLNTMTPEGYTRACEMTVLVKALKKEISSFFDEIVKKANEVHKEATRQRARALKDALTALKMLDGATGDYAEEQDRKAAEESSKREAAGKEAEEKDRMARAEAAEAGGRHTEAQRIIDTPRDPREYAEPTEEQPAAVPQVEGFATRRTWSVDVRSVEKLVRAAAAGRVPMTCLMGDEKALKKLADITGVEGEFVPGVFAKRERHSVAKQA